MSLFRQIWLAIILTTVVAFGGSFIIGLLSARGYLEAQLAIKNADNAEALALSISQQPSKEPVTLQLLVAAQFDTGHYASIRLVDPFGKAVVERVAAPALSDAPAWFAALFPIESAPGTAQVSSGWKQLGTVTVVSHSSFAYRELWRSSLRLLAWFALAGTLTGLAATAVLRRLRRPLAAVVAQAEAIGERRFVTIAAPGVPELDSLSGAMNAMVGRLKAVFDDQASRLEELRRSVNHDALTGLPNRSYFENHFTATLASAESAPAGTLMLLRVPELVELNARRGRASVDTLLVEIAHCIETAARPHHESFAARLNGADFALLLPALADGRPAADEILSAIRGIGGRSGATECLAQIGLCRFERGMAAGATLARADRALAAAESVGGYNWQYARDEDSSFQPATSTDWRQQIRRAIDAKRLRLAAYPVCTVGGELIHRELMLRVRIEEQGEWLPAGQILPMAIRLKLTGALDLAALDLALDQSAESADVIALNISAESIEHEEFRHALVQRLQSARRPAGISIEIPENGLLRHFAAVRSLRDAMAGTGCGLGIEHVGRSFSEISRLHELGLDYLKIDASFINGIAASGANRSFLEGVVSVARAMGAKVIAEGVENGADLAALVVIGFDGATGPYVTRMHETQAQ